MGAFKLFKKYFLNRQPASGPVKQNDFAMHLEPVDLQGYKKQLFSFGFAHKILETIHYKNKLYEIFQINVPGKEARKRLLIFAGVHGNEFAAALSVIDALKDIKQNHDHYAHLDIRIVTPLNPVGFVHQSRYNEVGRDINRDFKDFSTTGGRIQKEVIEQFKPDVLISLHEGPQDGFFVITEGNTPKAWRGSILQALKSERVELARKIFGFGVSIEGYWYKWRFVYGLQKLLGIYTLGRYAYEQGVILLTTESSWTSKDIEARKKPHVTVIRAVAGRL
jgi:hypothetical protein